MRSLIRWGAWVLVCGLTDPVEGQDRSRVQCGAVDGQSTTVVTARLVGGPNRPDLRRRVWIENEDGSFRCAATPSDEGRFELIGVPQGDYVLRMGSLGLRPMAPMPFHVESDTPVNLAVPVFREDRIAQCSERPACVGVIARSTTAERVGGEQRSIKLAAYRLGIALAGGRWRDEEEWVACIDDASDVLEALREVYAAVVQAAECGIPSPPPGERRNVLGRFRHIHTDLPARFVSVEIGEVTADSTASVHVSYQSGGLGGEGHDCELLKSDQTWVPTTCRMTWVS